MDKIWIADRLPMLPINFDFLSAYNFLCANIKNFVVWSIDISEENIVDESHCFVYEPLNFDSPKLTKSGKLKAVLKNWQKLIFT